MNFSDKWVEGSQRLLKNGTSEFWVPTSCTYLSALAGMRRDRLNTVQKRGVQVLQERDCAAPGSGHTHHLVLEPQEVGAVEVPVLEQQRGVTLLQVSARQSDQRPDLGKEAESIRGCPDGHSLQVGPLPMAGAELRFPPPGEEKYSEEKLLEGQGPLLLCSLSAGAWPWLRAGAA